MRSRKEVDRSAAKWDGYRESVRETFQSMSNEALRFQDSVVIGGIDREELDREINRRLYGDKP